ncbi:MAG: formylglycine-generating enzyme family protein [Polyangiaceae bacterium]
MSLRRLLPAMALTACACSPLDPEPQIVLYVDTDAPLHSIFGEQEGLFDTLVFDVYLPGSDEPCPRCTREFAVDAATFRHGEASIGLLDVAEGTRVRVRLFSDRYRRDGVPNPDSTLDAFVAIPVPDGVEEVHVRLPTERVARPFGTLDEPIEAVPGAPLFSVVGTFVERTSCAGSPREGEACMPGGAFWMGNPRILDTGVFDSIAGVESRVDRMRIVVIDPFYIDLTETTVDRFAEIGPVAQVPAWSGEGVGTNVADYFTLGADEDLPINGVTWQEARDHCQARGGDLPTEAQFEYAASDLRGSDYPWGPALPSCDDAVWGRGGLGPFAQATSTCTVFGLTAKNPRGPRRVGRADRDFVAASQADFFGGRRVKDLAGNVGEWARDFYAEQDSSCWPTGVVHNPICDDASAHPDWRPVRGGRWTEPPSGLMAAVRSPEVMTARSPSIGFRCVRAAESAE